MFAYGGIEVVGGLVDQTKNPEKNFPKGIILASFIIAVGYSLGIFLVGIFTNWSQVLSSKSVHMGNVGYVVMNNLGYQLAHTFGASQAVSLSMGAWMARFVGLSILQSSNRPWKGISPLPFGVLLGRYFSLLLPY